MSRILVPAMWMLSASIYDKLPLIGRIQKLLYVCVLVSARRHISWDEYGVSLFSYDRRLCI